MDNQMSVNIERIFETTPDIVWKMWTDAETFKTWYGPNGFSIDVMKMNVVEGGEQFVCMIMPGGDRKIYTTGIYKEVVVNQKLIYTDSPCDDSGNILAPESMGMPAGSQMTTDVVVELEEIDGKTKMIMKHIGVPKGAKDAWNQAFDKMVISIGNFM